MALSATSPAITKHDIETRLIEKCWREPGFRRQALGDPKGAFERQLGHSLPADLKVLIHEDSANTINLTLPPMPARAVELSEDELERVAGGTEFVGVLAVVTTVMAGVASAGVVGGAAAGTVFQEHW